MRLLEILVLFSSISFLAYGITYFTSPKMKSEFVRFGLTKFGILTAILEIVGALGLFVGFMFMFKFILLISSGGLALLMFLGVAARLRVKDGLLASSPALFYFGLNLYILLESMKIFVD